MATYLVLDTNALPQKGILQSAFWSLLFRLCALKEIRPSISEVTLHEAVNLRRETADKLLSTFVSSNSQLSQMTTMDAIYTPSGTEVAKVLEDRLNEVFEILPLGGEHAREAFRREARRVLPARLGKGGRDSAIWLTVAALANEGHKVFFVTNNSKDFGTTGLFAGLLAEVASAEHPVTYLDSTNSFVDAIATKVDLPDPPDQSLADAFDLSIRSEFIEFLDDKDSAEYTVERVWNARLIVAESRIGQGYVIDDGGLAQVRASVALADASGAEWATAKIDGWLNFEPHTFAANESDSSLSDFELKFQ